MMNSILACAVGTESIMALEKEQATYARELPRLSGSAGKFVVIHGDEVAGMYDTYDDALTVAYERFGLSPFLVKKIEVIETVHRFTRDLGTCRT
jgi:hypothetical protein